MTLNAQNYIRILAVRPTHRGFGFAVLEGKDILIDWGVANVFATSTKEFLARIEGYVDRYVPAAIALEGTMHPRRRGIGARRVKCVVEYAKRRHITVIHVSRENIRQVLNMPTATKHELAFSLARLFPDLEPYIPPPKKPWASEDERMNLFEAVGMALVASLCDQAYAT